MKYKNIILDGHNLFWRSWYHNTTEYLTGETTIYSGGIESFIKRFRDIQAVHGNNDTNYYLLFDNPESTVKMRKDIDEEYKSHRLNNKYSSEINRSIQYLREILRSYLDNTFIIWIDQHEADDIVPMVLERCQNELNLLISADLDWSRSISEKVHWYNYKKIYTLDEFKKDYDFYPNNNRIKLYKALHGDNSDNIPNAVPHLPKDLLLYIIEKYSMVHIKDFTTYILRDDKISKDWRYKIKNAENRIKMNYSLVDFIKIPENLEDHLQECTRNKALARIWCNIIDIDVPPWAIDLEKPSDFLSAKTFRKGKKRK